MKLDLKDKINCDVAKEILTFISFLDNNLVTKIPSNVLTNLAFIAADSTKNYYIDKTKKLNEQNMSEECKYLLNSIFSLYIVND